MWPFQFQENLDELRSLGLIRGAHGGLVGKSSMDVFYGNGVFGDLKLAPGTKKRKSGFGIPDSKHHFCGSFFF